MSELKPLATVIGCAPGSIGEAFVRELLKRGFNVIATRTTITEEDKKRIADPHCKWLSVDVNSNDSVQQLERVVQLMGHGRLDLLLHVAGLPYTIPATDIDPDLANKVVLTNVVGPMRTVKYLHAHLVAAKGSIALIGSIAGFLPFPWMSVYNCTKAAMHQWGQTLRIEMAPFGVKVHTVVAGNINTQFLHADQHHELPDDSLWSPLKQEVEHCFDAFPPGTDVDDFARTVLRQMDRKTPSALYWTGAMSTMAWFLSSFLPYKACDLIFWRTGNFQAIVNSRPKA